MKANEDKCNLIVYTDELTEIQMRDFSIKNSASEKLLVLTLIANLFLIVMLTIYAIKQIKNSEHLLVLHRI